MRVGVRVRVRVRGSSPAAAARLRAAAGRSPAPIGFERESLQLERARQQAGTPPRAVAAQAGLRPWMSRHALGPQGSRAAG